MPELTAIALLALLGAYLIGSLSSAVMLCKVSGLPDPRTQGSGNPGATNVLRMGSKKLAALVLLIDVLKGVIPVLIGRMLGFDIDILALIAFFAFLGHLYPVFFQFKGGKGVATALGAFLALSPALAGAALLTWILVFAISRISSLSAIAAAAMTPVYSLWLIDTVFARTVILFIALLLLWRHRSNIQRLLAGEEKKSG
ncbi:MULTISPECIES: glycerol-3-phosphate 1-O-acyltransferase PlsY [unclassified Methylophaga]|jgi:glycerol-3-phosphate acyltransferase PlsY|uniref:glycerol-3-phosphate 1-O-acyltransferase PlsY n=2 Tax=Methylophaga TaxID=40222 RepID=UPI000C8FDC7C|nr:MULTISPECIES: glycerol-3-phosphate 1-O-acyltransferase PlsY [unclassified Methylophaga]MAK67705.1 acyl-phosphate glycerol 3-phosphate acyltransferase [Methylophaga sp.]MAY17897.1 acyl-phosphate glycerol 3-phosphate acyltransferase [Methylophaga sp.]MBN45652.1 acyl-phosphate glycerol 3-phosphate acyltransferase [Methylophaga sp.]HAO26118.1 acyl-phosphate glycerol 3-phosphate acyltransferase [Methylophaga sp.]HCD04904.1 acyl-phosphate glycerol 3-phosphate acyltransferase [Methylophaga sp.]|tara:strand:- start:1148 stop:1744 length:597 start_codon:yes stop_codon:yes gene_type:complete